MLEHDDHFKHGYDNPTYIRPEDWRALDDLIDWIIDKNRTGYQMVNSVQKLREMKAFVRMSSGLDVGRFGWYGDRTCTDEDMAKLLASTFVAEGCRGSHRSLEPYRRCALDHFRPMRQVFEARRPLAVGSLGNRSA